MARHGIKRLVSSSKAASFGLPEYTPIDEYPPKAPINPCGRSKWIVEQLLADSESAYGLQSVCLRSFNAAGANPVGVPGERHQPETHLIPLGRVHALENPGSLPLERVEVQSSSYLGEDDIVRFDDQYGRVGVRQGL